MKVVGEYPIPNTQYPIPSSIGYLTWAVLLALSLLFYRERAFFMDAGFQLFNLINEGKIQVYHYRFVTAVPQVVPFLLMKMGAPLWALGMGFSAAYILFYFSVWVALVRWLRQEVLGWVLLSLLLLMTFDGFYHIQSEFNLGLALLLLAFGVVLRNARLDAIWQWALLMPLAATVGFSHKLSIIFVVFLWVFMFLNIKELRHWRYGLLLGVFLLVTAFKSVFFTNWYEAAKQEEFAVNLGMYWYKLWAIPANLVFAERCLHYYYLLPLLLAIVTLFYLKRRQWLKLGLVWSFSLGYLLLYNIADPQSQYRFYAEVSLLPLSIFVAVPFFIDVLPGARLQATAFRKFVTFGKLWPATLLAILALRLATIAWNHSTVAGQFAWIKKQVNRPGNRFLLPENQAPLDTVLMTWGVPFTAMHLSALESPDSAKTLLILPDFQWFEKEMDRDDVFFSPFHKVLKKSELNQDYYRLKSGRYLMLE